MPSLPYHEPDRIAILVQSSFLFCLNVVESLLNRALYCGLLGQVLLGIAFGTPGGNIISHEAQQVMVEIGYLGLILLVYEGGLSVPLKPLKDNIYLSTVVAVTGVALPIALSFILQPLMNATPLQAFAAGAALCSTSLGTTFTVLSTSGLMNTRLGSVLSTAAMMDDVLGLVMVQVIGNLGHAATSFNAVVVVRPIMVSLAFAIIIPVMLRFIIRPVRHAVRHETRVTSRIKALLNSAPHRFLLHCLLLFGMVAAAAWSGTSILFTAYLAGAIVNWWDNQPSAGGEVDNIRSEAIADCPADFTNVTVALNDTASRAQSRSEPEDLSGATLYHRYLAQPVKRILRPLFFASIGFSIPITALFQGPLLWRGLVYASLMIIAKLVCGIWLLPPSSLASTTTVGRIAGRFSKRLNTILTLLRRRISRPKREDIDRLKDTTTHTAASIQLSAMTIERDNDATTQHAPEQRAEPPSSTIAISQDSANPRSLYPATVLGFAMVARGEIGFLISAVAESAGIWRTSPASSTSSSTTSDMFIVVTWAIFVCTFIGPIVVGLIVNRIRRLEKERGPVAANVLGSWGIVAQ